MTPLEEFHAVEANEWKIISSEKPRHSGGPKKRGYLVEDELIKSVLENGSSYELQYTTAEEADKMRVRLNARVTGKSIRVLTQDDKPNSIFIGPIISSEEE